MTFQKGPYKDAHKESAHGASNGVSVLISPWVNLRSINSQCMLIVSMPNSYFQYINMPDGLRAL